MKVLFVYSNHIADVQPAPPVGLSYVATATEASGHQVRFVDLFLGRGGMSRLRAALRSFQPEVVAVSVRNIDNVISQRLVGHLAQLREQVALIRRESRARLILGGSAISILGSRVLAHVDADLALSGEGEEVFPALLARIEAGADPGSLPGVHVRERAPLSAGLPQRCAAFGPSGMERWISWPGYERRGATWPIQCKRGCPQQCTYCCYPAIEGRKLRLRAVEEVVAEINRVSRLLSPRCFEFIDSVFNIPEEYALRLCEELIRAGPRAAFTAMGINPQRLSAGLLALMRRAGFNSLMVTPESASDQVLAGMRKGFGRDEVIRAAELIRAARIPSLWFFMLGAPGETEATAEETISFAEEHLSFPDCLPVFTTGVRILPGTQLAEQAIAEGYLEPEQDLTASLFYFSPQVSEQRLLARVNRAIARCPAVVHAAEDPASSLPGRVASRLLHLFGAAPPYWRFYPRFLALPFVHKSRSRQ
jgi:radical SAM superfamily enzyme YgiQ (UPF0313 family)